MVPERKQMVQVVVAVCALVAASGLIVTRGGRVPPAAYYYDLQTGDLFSDDGARAAPIDAPSGALGVRAHVYACGNCADQTSRYIAWISKFSDEAKMELAKSLNKQDPLVVDKGSLVSAPSTDPTWLPAETNAGYAVISAMDHKCDDAVRCQP